MGPVAAVAVFAATTTTAVIATQRHDNHVHVDNFLGSQNIGGQLTQVKRTQELRETKTVTKEELDQYLRKCGVPEDKIVEAQKLKIANIGSVESLEFMITESQFAGRIIVVRSKKTATNQIQIMLCKDRIEAKYSAPQIQSNYSSSGGIFSFSGVKYVKYAARPLSGPETATLTEAVKNKAKQVSSQLKAISV